MIKGNLPYIYFQTFYVSKEKSNCPLIAIALRVEKKIKEYNVSNIIISQRYGKRILINSLSDPEEEKRNNFLEIIDYDPLKKVLLVMGPKEPGIDTPVHWLIHHARNEVNAIIQINDIELAGKSVKKLPITEGDFKPGTLEQAKEILKCLKNSKGVYIENQGVIFVGNNINEVEKLILEVLK